MFLSGCYDITEEVTIEPSGKGVYVTNIDMGQLMSMIKTYAAMDSSKDLSIFNQNLDSTIYLKSYADTAKDLDPETRKLMGNATVRMIIRADSNVFKITMKAPFENLGQLQKLQNQLSKAGGGMQSIGTFLGGKGSDSSKGDNAPGMSPDHINDVLHTAWTDHKITRALDQHAYDNLMKDSLMQQAKQMASLMGDAKFKTIIHLPRPAKKVESKSSLLSDDRKTITFERSLSDMFYAPADFTFTIDY
jgi:hypothetical protein